MSTIEFKLPDLGEGIESGTVVKVLVSEGEAIAAEQLVMEIASDKATIELPCPHAGTVRAIHVAVDAEVDIGALLLTLEASEGASSPEAAPAPQPAPASQPAPAPQPAPVSPPETPPSTGAPLPAGPAVRRLARLMGVDLSAVRGGGQRGRIRPEDVHAYVKSLAAGSGGGGPALPPMPDFATWGEVELQPLSKVRKLTAEAMARSWSTIPHVTQHDLADVTELEAARKAHNKANPQGPKVTMTVLIAKACAAALRRFPDLNSSLDLVQGHQVFKRYVHLGIAVDTEYGLLVPVLRDVDRKSVLELAGELNDLAVRTRDRKVRPDELKGGTFTISNLGGIGGTGFTPIVNWPEVAILGVSRSSQEYRMTPEGPDWRLMMPLSLSYDHRLVDGAQACRFTRYVAELLSSPTRMLFAV